MTEKTPIQTALDAEQLATLAVEEAGRLAAAVREQAREQARHIESRAQSRIAAIQRSIDAQIESHRKSTEAAGAAALRQLREEAIDSDAMASAIESLLQFILIDDKLVQPGEGI